MVLHIFTQVGDYAIDFLRLLQEKFEVKDHVIVFRNGSGRNRIDPVYKGRVLYIESRKDMSSRMPELIEKADRIIFHSFPVSRSLFFWYRYRTYLSKAAWSVWGQDAYWYNYCKKNLENRVYEWIRTWLIRRISIVFCPIRGDFDFIRQHYKTRAAYMPGMYPIPTDFEALLEAEKKVLPSKDLKIQVGNSANPTNNTLEVLEFLATLSDRQFRVFCPVSYGDNEYAKQVAEAGKRLLGEKFNAVTEFMNREQYAAFVASMDILIMNHQRQQGLGNIFSYLYLGKKVYIRSDNSSYSFFHENGIQVFNTRDLLSGQDILQPEKMRPENLSANRNRVEKLISKEYIAEGWKRLFN